MRRLMGRCSNNTSKFESSDRLGESEKIWKHVLLHIHYCANKLYLLVDHVSMVNLRSWVGSWVGSCVGESVGSSSCRANDRFWWASERRHEYLTPSLTPSYATYVILLGFFYFLLCRFLCGLIFHGIPRVKPNQISIVGFLGGLNTILAAVSVGTNVPRFQPNAAMENGENREKHCVMLHGAASVVYLQAMMRIMSFFLRCLIRLSCQNSQKSGNLWALQKFERIWRAPLLMDLYSVLNIE